MSEKSKPYPTAPRGDVVREYHGKKVPDPYAWLEDIDSQDTVAWLKAQSELTRSHLDALPERGDFLKRLRETVDYTKQSMPELEGGRLFYFRRVGLEKQARYFWRAEEEGAEEYELFNPNQWSDDGTVALTDISINQQGTLVAYGISKAGSDWKEWKIRAVDTGQDLPEILEGIKFSSASWDIHGKGFYYGRFELPAPGKELSAVNENQKVYYHTVGLRQADDRLVYSNSAHPKRQATIFQTQDTETLMLFQSEGAAGKGAWGWRATKDPDGSAFHLLTPEFVSSFRFIAKFGEDMIFLTDHGAPKGRLIAIPMHRPAESNWRTLIAERKDLLMDVSCVGGAYIVEWLKDASSRVTFHDLAGKETGEISLAGIVSVSGFWGRPDQMKTFYVVSGFTQPGEIRELQMGDKSSRLFWKPKVPFDTETFETVQLFCTSRDGTRVPMFLTRRKGAAPDRPRPLLLTGYGGFGISLTPGFDATLIPWLEKDALHVTVNLRGGGEYGEAWHVAGQLEQKQNVFDDFIAVSEYLINEGWTDKGRLAIQGGSNGGLLIGAVLNQRPDLFAAASPAVGVMDMLRYDQFTIGWAWRDEFGDPATDLATFQNLRTYSPLHNIRPEGGYPPVLITTGDHDDRVFPAHSFKYAAELQRANQTGSPVLLRVELRSGHGAGLPLDKALEALADLYAFFWEFVEK